MEQLKSFIISKRIGAFLIDHFIFSFLVCLTIFLILDPTNNDFSSLFISINVLIFGAFILYCYKDIVNGRSIGKRIFGLAVREENDNNNVPKASKLIIRNLFTFLWPIDLILILASKRKKKIGDRLVNTDVFMLNNRKTILGITLSLVSIFIYFICILFFGVLQIIKQDESYKIATEYIKNSTEIRNLVGNEITFGYFPMGSIQYKNGQGTSELTIKVMGSKDTISVHVVQQKTSKSNWIIEKVDF
ncbi:RDD family protein [Paenibacillus sp. UNC451MF]|uniref:RDD family protein n=1 Tax=Paenibacillus sp. UNC451MF TaxID=1449063 RepID=UPI0018CC14CC|nr:cytochrome c oxidase assembly factor Coa1 family protein [Paenibacillus sp. UNC451MF]